MGDPYFWSIVKANLFVAVCTISFSIVLTIVIAALRRRLKKAAPSSLKKMSGPQAILIGGADPKPAHCPLCGQGWPLPGPVLNPPPELPK